MLEGSNKGHRVTASLPEKARLASCSCVSSVTEIFQVIELRWLLVGIVVDARFRWGTKSTAFKPFSVLGGPVFVVIDALDDVFVALAQSHVVVRLEVQVFNTVSQVETGASGHCVVCKLQVSAQFERQKFTNQVDVQNARQQSDYFKTY